jgi:outer membrane protein insertion porin family
MLRRLLTCVFLLNLTALCLLDQNAAQAQVTDSTRPQSTDTTRPISIDPELNALATTKTPKEYTLAGIKITGTKFLDETLLVSISGLTVGDKVIIPGGDNFSKAITKLWEQKLFSDITIYYTRIVGNSIYIEINVTERPRLSNFYFKGQGVKKGDADDLAPKSGLIKGRVVTENMKRTAEQAIKKFYADKGYQVCQVRIVETWDPSVANSDLLTFYIDKGNKVRVAQINFYGNMAIAES